MSLNASPKRPEKQMLDADSFFNIIDGKAICKVCQVESAGNRKFNKERHVISKLF